MLAFWFQIGSAIIKWKNSFSNPVLLTAGVKQGGILSPLLFTAFIDVVLSELGSIKVGCFLNGKCLNSALYADDLILLSLSISDLQILINKCCQVLDNLDLQINAEKSSCIRIGPRFRVGSSPISAYGKEISWASEARYLGMTLLAGVSFRCDWHLAKRHFFTAVNSILASLGSNPDISVVLSLFTSKCVPILNYGLVAIQLSKVELNSFSFAFDNIFHKLFKTNNKKTLFLCQYYSNVLPFNILYDLSRFNFLSPLFSAGYPRPADCLALADWRDWTAIANKYNFLVSDSSKILKYKIRAWLDNAVDADG